MKYFLSLGRSLCFLICWFWALPAAYAQAPVWQGAWAVSNSSITASAADGNGNVYVAGTLQGPSTFGGTTLPQTSVAGSFVAKWSTASSSFVWAQPVGGTVNAVAVNGTSVYVAGSFTGTATFGTITYTENGNGDGFVAKLEDTGTSARVVWAERLGGGDADAVRAVAASGTSVYVAGSFASAVSFGGVLLISAGNTDAFVAKLTDAGASASVLWAQRGGGSGPDGARAVAVSGTDVYATGMFNTNTGNIITSTFGSFSLTGQGVFVCKLTDAGSSSSYTWVLPCTAITPNALAVSGTSVYVAGGHSGPTTFGSIQLNGSSDDIFVAKILDAGSSASFTWALSAGGNFYYDIANGLVAQGNRVYVVGLFSATATFGTTVLALAGTGGNGYKVFVSQATDAGGTGSWAWARQGGSSVGSTSYPALDVANTVALSGNTLYVAGLFSGATTSFGTTALTGSSGPNSFLAAIGTTVLGTRAPAWAAEIAVLPNPAHGRATVQLPAIPGAATATLTVLDALGRTLRTQTAATNSKAVLDLAGLPFGFYAVRVAAGSGTATQRLVVE